MLCLDSRGLNPQPSTIPLMTVPSVVLHRLSERSRECIERLSLHKRDEPDLSVVIYYSLHTLILNRTRSNLPSSKLAAVLVILYENAGELRVVLTTRSKLLRSHPGQVDHRQ